ncbi:hypothetical protein ACOMHN_001903 [Nucella lapillus]
MQQEAGHESWRDATEGSQGTSRGVMQQKAVRAPVVAGCNRRQSGHQSWRDATGGSQGTSRGVMQQKAVRAPVVA